VVYDEDDHSMLMLNTSAAAVWSRCDGTKSLGDIVDELAGAHGTAADRIVDDVWETVCKLAALGLVADARSEAPPTG
jgi:hypothetical protein